MQKNTPKTLKNSGFYRIFRPKPPYHPPDRLKILDFPIKIFQKTTGQRGVGSGILTEPRKRSEGGTERAGESERGKSVKKLFKKVLTKRNGCGIITRSLGREQGRRRSLKIEQQDER